MSEGDTGTRTHHARRNAGAGLLLTLVAFAAILAGPVPLAVVVGALLLLAYVELRRILGAAGSSVTLVAGGAAVAAALWVAQADRPEHLPWVLGGLVVVLLTLRVLLVEVGRGPIAGATDDVAATVTAAGVIGVLGAHVLLIRSLPRWGFVGLLVFGLMLLARGLAAGVVTRMVGGRPLAPRISADKTWPGVLAGALAAIVVGAVAGLALSPPFGVSSGMFLAVGVAILAPAGDLSEDALKRGAGVRGSGGPRGFDGVLDALDGPLFCAPFFYWAFRTLVI